MRLVAIIFLAFWADALYADRVTTIIESSDTHYAVSSDGNLSSIERLRMRVLDHDGYRNAIFREYYDQFRKIKSLKYVIYDANNKKIKTLNKGDALDLLISSSYEISDARVLIVNPEYQNFPFTVEITVEIAYKGFISFPVWMPRYTHNLEVQQARLSIDCPKAFQFRSKEINGVAAPRVISQGDNIQMEWSLHNLRATEEHLNSKTFYADQPRVLLAPLSFKLGESAGSLADWGTFADWFAELNEGRNALNDDTRKFLDELRTTHGNDDGAISKNIYRFLQGKTRYISIQLGIGGFRATPSDEVERTGYGDCKALTNYMKSMLDWVNIKSHYVLVRAGRDVPDIDKDFPSNQFNHVFLAVPLQNDTLWFECTNQQLPPDYIGSFTDDRHVLWVDKGRSTVIKTPSFEMNESVIKRTGEIILNEYGDATLRLNVHQNGVFFDEYLLYANSPKDKIEKYNYSKFYYNDFTINSFNFTVPNRDVPEIDLTYQLAINAIGKSVGNKMIIPVNFLTPIDRHLQVDVMQRKSEVRRGFTIQDSLVIKLPEKFRVNLIPPAIVEISDFGSVEIKVNQVDDMIHVYRKATVKKGYYENEEFDRFNEAMRKLNTVEQTKLIVHSKT